MIDINIIKTNPEILRNALKHRNKTDVTDALLAAHGEYVKDQGNRQQLLEQRNKLSEQFGKAKATHNNDLLKDIEKQVQELKIKIGDAENLVAKSKEAYENILFAIPNIPVGECPVGPDESANLVIKQVGTPKTFNFKPKEHNELGETLGMMDFKRASKIAGSRFVFLFSDLARLERALAQFMLDLQRKNGYTEVYVPLILEKHAMFGVGQLPKFEEDLFKTTVDSYLIPTAEAALTNIFYDEIIKGEELPLRFCAYTPCFRSEAGAAGRDTTGMIRQHQFGKVELVSIVAPSQSNEEHERMTRCAEQVLETLELPYQRVLLSTGDMGFASEKTFDLEVWLPGQNKYREISSCSKCNAFQARRMNTRFKNPETKKNEFVHTLNGSGLAVGRCLIAVLENYQQEDGSVTIPQAIVPYMGGQKSISAQNR